MATNGCRNFLKQAGIQVGLYQFSEITLSDFIFIYLKLFSMWLAVSCQVFGQFSS